MAHTSNTFKSKPKQPFKIWRLLFFGLVFIVLIAVAFYFIKGWPVADYLTKIQGTEHLTSQLVEVSNNLVKFNVEEYKLPENNNNEGLNLIFFADQYLSWEEFESDINALMSEIKTIEPWQSYQYFNIYKINPKKTDICYITIEDERKSTLRCQLEINNYLNNLPLKNFRLIVLSRQEFQSWANVVRYENSGIFFSVPKQMSDMNKKVNGLLFSHLLGHVFGLKDEEIFVLAKAGGSPHTPDGPNCAPDVVTAEKWWGDLTKEYPEVGYFKGCCGDENYIKPTQSSIMNLNTGASIVYTYGPVSEEYLKKVLTYCFMPNSNVQVSTDSEFFKQYPKFKECLE